MDQRLKKALVVAGSSLGAIVLAIGVYGAYTLFTYRRLGNQTLKIESLATNEKITVGNVYKAVTYNIGSGINSQDFTSFDAQGYDELGNSTRGSSATAKTREEVDNNTSAAVGWVRSLNPHFAFFQEVDTNSSRSFHVNQQTAIKKSFTKYDQTYAINSHHGYLFTPFGNPQGGTKSGLVTASNIKMKSSERRECKSSSLFDLDRCFSVNEVETSNDKSLFLVNVHLPTCDSNPNSQEERLKELNQFLKEKKDSGDYVIVGGDFNQDLLINNPDLRFDYTETKRPFGMKKKAPDWLTNWFKEDGTSPLTEGYTLIANDNVPSRRNCDIQWNPDKSFTCVTDGFIVSDNIKVSTGSCRNVLTDEGNLGLDGFACSNHEPVLLEFRLI